MISSETPALSYRRGVKIGGPRPIRSRDFRRPCRKPHSPMTPPSPPGFSCCGLEHPAALVGLECLTFGGIRPRRRPAPAAQSIRPTRASRRRSYHCAVAARARHSGTGARVGQRRSRLWNVLPESRRQAPLRQRQGCSTRLAYFSWHEIPASPASPLASRAIASVDEVNLPMRQGGTEFGANAAQRKLSQQTRNSSVGRTCGITELKSPSALGLRRASTSALKIARGNTR